MPCDCQDRCGEDCGCASQATFCDRFCNCSLSCPSDCLRLFHTNYSADALLHQALDATADAETTRARKPRSAGVGIEVASVFPNCAAARVGLSPNSAYFYADLFAYSYLRQQ